MALSDKEKIYEFLEDLQRDIEEVFRIAKKEDEDFEIDKIEGSKWLPTFKKIFVDEATGAVAPENVAKVALPATIVIGCTAIGTIVGQPIAGALVGGMIATKGSPDKAMAEIVKENR